MSFESLGLSARLLRAINEQGYCNPTPIQRQAIPVVLQGRDLLASAQTGTGKTASFTLPILQLLQSEDRPDGYRPVRALILTPTRELAAQVEQSVNQYGRHLPITSAAVFGGTKISPQIKHLRKGVDVMVATPGRLLDHISQNTVDLSSVEILVLDEADRMLDMGFINDIRKILARLPGQKQTLLFSATFSKEIRQLANGLLQSPERIDVAKKNVAADRIEQIIHPIDKKRKRELLSFMIGSNNWKQVLVFTRTKHTANRLAVQLGKDGIKASAIHGNKSQGARTKALADFKQNRIRVLVATDIAARGLDIHQLPHVINYELPNVPEDYVHRIGRTGRAGQGGEARSLVSADENKLLHGVERLLKRKLTRDIIDGYEPEQEVKHEPDTRKQRPSPKAGNKPKLQTNNCHGKPSARGNNNPRRRSRKKAA